MSSTGKRGLKAGAIAGIVIGVLAGLIVAVLALICIRRRRRLSASNEVGMGPNVGGYLTGGAQVSQMAYTQPKAPVTVHTGTPVQTSTLGSEVLAMSPETPLTGKRALILGLGQSHAARSRDASAASTGPTIGPATSSGLRALPALPASPGPISPPVPPVQAEDEFEERFQARLMQFLQTNMDPANSDVDGRSEAALPRYPGS
jgi:hypothetical protein